MPTAQKITPFLWFEKNAEQAAKFYVSIFKNSKITNVARYGAAGPGKKGAVMLVTYLLDGQEFYALNGDATFKFNPAISLFVHCKTQQEIDHLWKKLSKGGTTQQCGWLTDKYGVTWQIVPTVLPELLESEDAAKAERVMRAMMGMVKLDIKGLKAAAAAGPRAKSAAKRK